MQGPSRCEVGGFSSFESVQHAADAGEKRRREGGLVQGSASSQSRAITRLGDGTIGK